MTSYTRERHGRMTIKVGGPPPPGHNSKPAHPEEGRSPVSKDATATDDRLRLLLERIERLREEKKGIGGDERDAFAELRAVGYDAKMARELLKLRAMNPDDRAEHEALRETYKCALGLG